MEQLTGLLLVLLVLCAPSACAWLLLRWLRPRLPDEGKMRDEGKAYWEPR